jgi:dimethylhistidine N-methyltransferase
MQMNHRQSLASLPSWDTPSERYEAINEHFLDDVLVGLSAPQKTIPSKYLYDERGSKLFDEICQLDEYYLTRAESSIMAEYSPAMARAIGDDVTLVELGSGSSQKTRMLLNHLDATAYLPIDISASHLHRAAKRIQREYPSVSVHPIVCDFTDGIEIPPQYDAPNWCVYFPGSTIGNLETHEVTQLLDDLRDVCVPQARLLVGFDLQKDPALLHAAYNDSCGVTARFTMNLIHRINRELHADFDPTQYRHHAFYNESLGRIEISIECLSRQIISIHGTRFKLERGERIRTEYSHKYTVDGFAELASQSAFALQNVWQDRDHLFAVAYLTTD